MRAPASLLHGAALANTVTGEPSSSPVSMKAPEQQQTAPVMAVNSDMVLILASLLCALVCVLGLALVSRCTCRRRRSASYSDHAPPPPKGLKKKAIHALPTIPFAANGASPTPATCSSSECAICLAEFTEGEALRVLPRDDHGGGRGGGKQQVREAILESIHDEAYVEANHAFLRREQAESDALFAKLNTEIEAEEAEVEQSEAPELQLPPMLSEPGTEIVDISDDE
ncbi:hypothetical protein TRIUR3_06201 [Triticum urartu]|uniref:RING-type domain-containing protein n=1 Tax=Triticum urartu TaxID=4572 RepID=M7YUJ1_TRIUA|nr:hypothetical protein TRIUR3_06201 [Triticum urartu]